METKINNFSIAVNETYIKNNHLPIGNFKLNPQISRSIGKVNGSDKDYVVEVQVEIRNTPEAPFPIDLKASISGVFNIEGDDEKEINNFLQTQGFQMVFPYLRAVVTNITTSAMMPAIVLPIVYANQFEDVKK